MNSKNKEPITFAQIFSAGILITGILAEIYLLIEGKTKFVKIPYWVDKEISIPLILFCCILVVLIFNNRFSKKFLKL
jgi:hypothetical protein